MELWSPSFLSALLVPGVFWLSAFWVYLSSRTRIVSTFGCLIRLLITGMVCRGFYLFADLWVSSEVAKLGLVVLVALFLPAGEWLIRRTILKGVLVRG